jgi:hypothetical protein
LFSIEEDLNQDSTANFKGYAIVSNRVVMPFKTSPPCKWPVRILKHNHIKNRYPLIIQRFSLMGRWIIWYIWLVKFVPARWDICGFEVIQLVSA